MNLVEKHIININHKQFKQIDLLCFLSKNLFNATLYLTKQLYQETGKVPRYNELEKILRNSNNPDYIALPPNSSQQILMLMDKNIKSYFALLKKWKKDKKSLNSCPKFPQYKHKTKGRNIVVFTTNQFTIKNGYIYFNKKSNLKPLRTLQTSKDNIRQIRIVPHSSCYKIEIVYLKEEKPLLINDNKASIDLGVNNLATLTFNNTNNSYIFNGLPLKSMNQYYNKKKGKLQSKLKTVTKEYYNKEKECTELKVVQVSTTKRITRLTLKRNNKVDNYLHNMSKKVVGMLLINNISELAIGYNKEWKQNINIGKRNNQNFVSIPFARFIDMLEYKCQLNGIKLITKNEAYTSKCSSLDLEKICKHENYLGKRVNRGLFKTSTDILINADVNGSLNIGRNVFGDSYVSSYLTNRGYVVYPIKVRL